MYKLQGPALTCGPWTGFPACRLPLRFCRNEGSAFAALPSPEKPPRLTVGAENSLNAASPFLPRRGRTAPFFGAAEGGPHSARHASGARFMSLPKPTRAGSANLGTEAGSGADKDGALNKAFVCGAATPPIPTFSGASKWAPLRREGGPCCACHPSARDWKFLRVKCGPSAGATFFPELMNRAPEAWRAEFGPLSAAPKEMAPFSPCGERMGVQPPAEAFQSVSLVPLGRQMRGWKA